MTHDETTGRVLLTKDQLADGCYYVGRCRNATMARWNAKEEQFYHWREKMGYIFIEKIKHPEDDEMFDVFRPVRLLEAPPFQIPFDEKAEWRDDSSAVFNTYNEEMWCECGLKGKCSTCRYYRARQKAGDAD